MLPMVDLYYQHTGDLSFIRDNIDTLASEMAFWKKRQRNNIRNELGNVTYNFLATYAVTAKHPRPEGYRQDVKKVEGLTGKYYILTLYNAIFQDIPADLASKTLLIINIFHPCPSLSYHRCYR